jgi:hypothetical protein
LKGLPWRKPKAWSNYGFLNMEPECGCLQRHGRRWGSIHRRIIWKQEGDGWPMRDHSLEHFSSVSLDGSCRLIGKGHPAARPLEDPFEQKP